MARRLGCAGQWDGCCPPSVPIPTRTKMQMRMGCHHAQRNLRAAGVRHQMSSVLQAVKQASPSMSPVFYNRKSEPLEKSIHLGILGGLEWPAGSASSAIMSPGDRLRPAYPPAGKWRAVDAAWALRLGILFPISRALPFLPPEPCKCNHSHYTLG